MPVDVLQAISEWRENLLDLSKRNRLINCRTGGRTSGVLIEHPAPPDVWTRLVVGETAHEFPWKQYLLGGSDELPIENEDSDGLGVDDDDESGGDGDTSGNGGAATAVDAGTKQVADERALLKACLESRELADHHILTALTDKLLAGRLQRLSLATQTALSEQGVNTLYLAFGFLRWFESQDSDEPLQSPLLLVPVRLHRPSLDANWQLLPSDEEIVPNHSLVQMLATNFEIDFPQPVEDVAERADGLAEYLAAVRHAVRAYPRWRVEERAFLGTFSFQKIAMWKDLGENGEKIAEHPMCRALAGDREQQQHEPSIDVPSADQLDDAVSPHETFHILESDSSQHEAIEAAKRGLSLVLDGPPGTGKSQTIANVIAEFVAQGKTVLFVSEKSAALEVVKRRLDQSALGDFCLECHSHKVNKKLVIEELGRCLGLGRESYATADRRLEELAEVRQRLNAYVRALHRPQGVLDLSPFAVHGRLARLHPASVTRCPIPDPLRVGPLELDRRVRALESFVEAGPVLEARGLHPWQGATVASFSLTLEDDIRHHFGRLAAFLPEYHKASAGLRAVGLVGDVPTVRELASAVEAARQAQTYPLVPARWFEVGAGAVASAYVELHAEVGRYRQLRDAAAKFADAAFTADWGRWVPAITGRGAVLGRVLGSDPDLRRSLDRTNGLLAALDAARVAVEQLAGVASQSATAIGAPKAVGLPVSDLGRLQRSAATVAALGRVSPSWFDTLRRREIREVVERGDHEATYLSGERRALDAMFQPAAFDPETLRLLDESPRYRSFFRRLLPRWRRHRRALASLYGGTAPSPAKALLADAERLAAYHQRRERLLRVGREHRDDLLATEHGAVDWEGVQINLAHVDELVSLGVLPETTFAELAARRVDQDAAGEAAADLASKLSAFEERLSVLKEEFGLDVTAELRGDGRPVTTDRVTGWIREVAGPARSLAEALSGVASVLNDGADVRIDECGDHADLCRQLSRQSERIASIFNSLSQVEADRTRPEERDWTQQAALGQWVTAFLKAHAGSPPPHLIAAVTDEKVRQQVRAGLAAVETLWDNAVEESWQFLARVFPHDRAVSVGVVIDNDPVVRVAGWLANRTADVARLREWVTYQVVRADLIGLGLGVLVSEIEDRRVAVADAPSAFLVRFYRLWLDAAYQTDAALAHFRAEDHETLIARFRELDEAHVRETYRRIRTRLLSSTAVGRDDGSLAPASSELGVLRRELNKKRRHLPLRQLFGRIPSLMLKLKPCVMMSPLAVSTYLDSEDIRFDLVVFDEASQVRPHDAVCAVYRGKQLIVAGDQKQLPPTNFFERLTDTAASEDSGEEADGEGGEELANYESILDVCSTIGLPRKRLRWHYRSRRESLIAFSNRHFYGDLVTFPSVFDVDGSSGVSLRFVEKGRWQSGKGGGFNAVEAWVTADMVMEHARSNPTHTLGVITMNQRQQTLLLEEIEKRRRRSPELEAFFDEKAEEPFFVKNLENVQGDERDVIFLSVGYGYDQAGKPSMNFGPLNKEGGERRLNVAVTRARLGLTLVSSIKSSYIDLSRTDKVGAKLLKAYLDFAERGVPALAAAVTEDGERSPDSEFEIEVANALKAKGLDVRAQVGCSGFRIDLALADPKAPGRYVLGIECDGATYHSSATARDRDRLRQSVLEGLGWRLCRIWSTDWVRDPAKQVARVLAEYERALNSPQPSVAGRPRSPAPAPAVKDNGTVAAEERPAVPQYEYRDIDEVRHARIEELVRRVLDVYGATGEEELVSTVARHLGFARTGKRISGRIEQVVAQMRRRSMLTGGDDGRVRLVSPD